MPHKSIDLHKIKTYPLSQRNNLVSLKDLIYPDDISPSLDTEDINHVTNFIIKARQEKKPVIWMMGAHVIKAGLGPIIIDLIKRDMITHIAGNGAVAIHDFELALIGETSEDVASSIEDGTFGMAHETGALIHQALRQGSLDRLGFGESLGQFIFEQGFPHRDVSVLYHAYKLKIPFTVHVTMGADIIHQHPDCDFGLVGSSSGRDFLIFCHSVSMLESGVFLNFGSAVTGPEVFIKALSISRNLGSKVEGFTTANFDLLPLPENYHTPINPDHPVYYYRPLKNIVNRPTSIGGQGFHIQGDHRLTIPTLYQHLTDLPITFEKSKSQQEQGSTVSDIMHHVKNRSDDAASIIENLMFSRPEIKPTVLALCQAYLSIAECFERGGHLFLYGNGGSMADAQHIVGELQKSFSTKRPLHKGIKSSLNQYDPDNILSTHLEGGLPAFALGLNPALNSAIDNDFGARWLNISQELQVLAKTGDIFFGISTSGRAQNIQFASYTARALGCKIILLTGEQKTALSEFADIAIYAPGGQTSTIQEAHIVLYHCLCEMLERDFFGESSRL